MQAHAQLTDQAYNLSLKKVKWEGGIDILFIEQYTQFCVNIVLSQWKIFNTKYILEFCMTGKDSNVHYKTSFAHIINHDVILATEASLQKSALTH